MYECLQGTVGLRSLCDDALIYVDDYPGIETDHIAKSASKDHANLTCYWESLEREASSNLGDMFIRKIEKSFQFKSVLDTDEIGPRWYNDGKINYYDLDDKYVGKEIYSTSYDSMISIRVDWIEVYAASEGKKRIYFRDHRDTEWYKDVYLIKGCNRIDVDFTGKYLKIWTSACDIQFAKSESCSCTGYDSCRKCSCKCYAHRNIELEEDCEWTSTGMDVFRVCVSCVCDKEAFVCKYRHELKKAYRLLIVAYIMDGIIGSTRKTAIAQMGKAEALNIRNKILGGEDTILGVKYEKPEFWVELNSVVSQVKGSISKGPCISCGKGVVYKEGM